MKNLSALLLVGLILVSVSAVHAKPPTLDPSYGLPLPKPINKPAVKVAAADWIWAATAANHQTVFLRRVFSLSRLPATAVMYLTADDLFTLYINGKQVDQSLAGAPGVNVWQSVHHLDVAPYLTQGQNTLAVEAQNISGAAGVVARLVIPGQQTVRTDRKWQVYSGLTPPPDWNMPDATNLSWLPATVIAPVQGGPWAESGGLKGWPGYSTRVPYLNQITLPVAAVLDVHHGAGVLQGISALPNNLSAIVTVTPPASGATDTPRFVIDFGKEVAGRLQITPLTAGTVVVGTGESLGEAIHSPWGGTHTLALVPGTVSHTPYSAFRCVQLTFPAALHPAPVRIQIALDDRYYPVVYQGAFSCSDPMLTKIWYTGAYTAHLCMQQDIWDAPKRDRARWCGDLNVSGDVINDVFADRFLMEKTLHELREDAQGGQPDNVLPKTDVNGIPGYSAAWFCTLADFYRHVGDKAYLLQQRPLILSLLAYEQQNFNSAGQYTNAHNAWNFVDWSPLFGKNDPQAYATTSFFLLHGIYEAAFLLRALGDTVNASKYASWDRKLVLAARQNDFQAQQGSYGKRLQENAMAVYSRVATPEQAQFIAQNILNPVSDAWDKVGTPLYNNKVITPYYGNYVLRALSIGGDTEDGLKLLRSYWGGMLAEGATTFWESYDPQWPKIHPHLSLCADNTQGYYVSLCHGWSSGPTSWLTERVLGVRPTSGGFKTAIIQPELGDLSWVQGTVPTPHGLIHVGVRKAGKGLICRVTLPVDVQAEVLLPGQKQIRLTHPGSYTFKNQ